MGKDLFETSYLTLQSKDRLFQLDCFLLGLSLSSLCKLCFFLIIHGICLCFLQFCLQVINGPLIHLLSLTTLNSGIGTLNESKQIRTAVDRCYRHSCFFCHSRNSHFVWFHATLEHSGN